MKRVAFAVLLGCGARTGLEVTERSDAEVPTIDAGSDVTGDTGVADRGPQIALDLSTICFRKDGELSCWGWNGVGCVGDGTRENRYTPTLVHSLSRTVEIATDDGHLCARRDDGTVRCWGRNTAAELGIGMVSPGDAGPDAAGVPIPSPVVGVSEAVQLSNHGSGRASCAKRRDGGYSCWGNEYLGVLPGLQEKTYAVPVDVPALRGADAVDMGDSFTCALFPGGVVECTGWNRYGELGDGTLPSLGLTPSTVSFRNGLGPVIGVTGAVDIALGFGAGYALMPDGSVRWWGAAFGPWPIVAEQHLTAVPLGLTGVVQIAAAGGHFCARMQDSTLQCRGANHAGQLGDGTLTWRTAMAPVNGLTDVVDFALGSQNTCAIVKSGKVYCWGENRFGQMGNGTSGPPQLTPTIVTGLP